MRRSDEKNETHEIIRRLKIAFSRIDALYLDLGTRLGVKPNLFVLFYALADGRVCSQRQICDEWNLPRTTLNSIVRECVKDGYVRLVPRGNKEKDIVLTSAGQEIVNRAFRPLFAAEAKAIRPIHISDVLDEIETLAARFEKAFAKLGANV